MPFTSEADNVVALTTNPVGMPVHATRNSVSSATNASQIPTTGQLWPRIVQK